MTAFGAADNDLSLSPGDPDLLGALGTFINMIVLAWEALRRKFLKKPVTLDCRARNFRFSL